jgi:membrane-associated phospholipid phosphatase
MIAIAPLVRRWPLASGSLIVALISVFSMAVMDRPLALWMKGHVGGDLEGFFKIVTQLGLGAVYLVPSGVAVLVCGLGVRKAMVPENRRRWAEYGWRCGFLFLAVASGGLVGSLIKVMVGRARPILLFEQNFYGMQGFTRGWAWNSFPSGHSQAAWAAMTALIILAPRHVALWVTIAVLVSLSRVATTVHFLSDVVAGGWLGILGAVVVARALERRGYSIHSPL